jgi:lysophospholipase L1-like esterase
MRIAISLVPYLAKSGLLAALFRCGCSYAREVVTGALLLCLLTVVEAENAPDKAGSSPDNWVASWGCAPGFATGQEFADQTIRQFVRLSAGGNRVRVRLSNETGTQPLVIGAAHLALAGSEKGSIKASSDRALTFNGDSAIAISPGSLVISDPVELDVQPLTKLAVSLYVARDTGSSVTHPVGQETGYVSGSGNQTNQTAIPNGSPIAERYFLTRIEVSAANNAGAIVAIGDSITDGVGSTPGADRRWPDRLAERLNEQGLRLGVVNAGMAGNRIWHDQPETVGGPSALSRFDRDVLSVPGVKFLIVFEGINDLTLPKVNLFLDQAVTAEQVIGGLKQLIDRARANHLKVLGATFLPGEGDARYGAQAETARKAVNQWIRTSRAFDGVIDFDAMVRDPEHPARIRPDFDSGDHVHPNDAGYRAMAEAIDLRLFGT